MSKKFKGKLCAYCAARKADTDDHVFAREFFLVEDRHGLPKAPACRECNNGKSKIEHYLTAVLPFGGRHGQAVDNLQAAVPGRLARNQKLHSALQQSVEPAWMRQASGIYQRTSVIDFDASKLEGLLKFVGRGLAWHHWKVYPQPADAVSVMFLTDTASALFASITSGWRNANRVVEDLGYGTIRYVGVQAAEPPELTVWTIWMYGGLVLSDDRRKADGPMESCSMWWVITGPPEIKAMTKNLR